MADNETALYLRVSSKQQEHRSQEPDMERWAQRSDGPVTWYRDTFTGKTLDRPGWSTLWRNAEQGTIGTIVVWRLDRLGRTARGLTALFDELRARKIGLISLREGFDLSTPGGRLMAHLLASVAEYETELRAERILAGQAAARAAGKRWGGSAPGRRLKVTGEQAELIQRLRSEGTPVAAIARMTALSRPTVYSVLAQTAPTP